MTNLQQEDYIQKFSVLVQSLTTQVENSADKLIQTKNPDLKKIVLLIYEYLMIDFAEGDINKESTFWDKMTLMNAFESEVNFVTENFNLKTDKERFITLVMILFHKNMLKMFFEIVKSDGGMRTKYGVDSLIKRVDSGLVIELLGSLDNVEIKLDSVIVKKYEKKMQEKEESILKKLKKNKSDESKDFGLECSPRIGLINSWLRRSGFLGFC